MIDDAQLIERLRDAELLTDPQLDEARDLQDREDRTLYEVLIAHQIVEEASLVEIVSEILNVASVDPREFEPETDILELVPARVALDNWAMPLETEEADGNARLVLAMRDPIDMFAMDEIASHTDVDIRPVLAGPRALHAALVDSYGDDEAVELDNPFESDTATPGGQIASEETDDQTESASWPSIDDSNPNETHPGLVTSNLSDTDDGEADDEDLTESADLSPVPTDSDLGTDSDPIDAAVDPPLDDDQAIGRIPVKRVPASQLEGDSSSVTEVAESGDPASSPLPDDSTANADGGTIAPPAPPETETPDGSSSDESPDDSNDKPDGDSSLAHRLLSLEDSVDPEVERRLQQASRAEILEATAVALIDSGTLAIRDLVDALGES